ncbi:MAG: hypothetical protein ACI94Y_004204, partial [Maribacter sp.]
LVSCKQNKDILFVNNGFIYFKNYNYYITPSI